MRFGKKDALTPIQTCTKSGYRWQLRQHDAVERVQACDKVLGREAPGSGTSGVSTGPLLAVWFC